MSTTLHALPQSEAAELRELEELWRTPALEPQVKRPGRVYPLLRRGLVWGWASFLVAVLALEPASDPNAASPLWGEVTLTTFWVMLLASGVLAWIGLGRAALAASAVAGAVGVAVGYACSATGHHLGNWWLVEAGACAGLALLSVACLAARASSSAT